MMAAILINISYRLITSSAPLSKPFAASIANPTANPVANCAAMNAAEVISAQTMPLRPFSLALLYASQAATKKKIITFYKYLTNLFSLSTRMIFCSMVFSASSKAIMMISSPFLMMCAAAPFMQITPEPGSP